MIKVYNMRCTTHVMNILPIIRGFSADTYAYTVKQIHTRFNDVRYVVHSLQVFRLLAALSCQGGGQVNPANK